MKEEKFGALGEDRRVEMVMEAEILKPYALNYSDLILLSSPSSSSSSLSSEEQMLQLDSIRGKIMEALGPSGPGLLSITGVPNVNLLRKKLLPLARKLSLLPNNDRARILKDHGLGSDVPLKNLNRTVSSFAQHMKLPRHDPTSGWIALDQCRHEIDENGQNQILKKKLESNCVNELEDCEFEILGYTFRELGFCMMELGYRLARICDKAIGGQELEDSILESCSAKGRLIHYHSTLDTCLLKESAKMNMKKKKGLKMTPAIFDTSLPCISPKMGDEEVLPEQVDLNDPLISGVKHCTASLSDLWQQWHYDYGIFTILTTPMFLSSSIEPKGDMKSHMISNAVECNSPHGHTYLQLLDISTNKILVVETDAESFIVQIGEAADIFSRGMLRSTLHSVCRPDGFENMSRENFVVFMQPAWGKVLDTPPEHDDHGNKSESLNCNSLNQDILKTVPPLTSRLKPGMTFAEFSRETTRQYYGDGAMQPGR